MLILEGPDNSGKSTLAKQLLENNLKDHELFKLSEVQAPTVDDLTRMIYSTVGKSFSSSKFVLDRFSFISEEVYGSTLRGGSRYGQVGMELLGNYIKLNPFFMVYCRPPYGTLLSGDKDEMEGVKGNELKLIKAYDDIIGYCKESLHRSNTTGAILEYDWNNPEGLDDFLGIYKDLGTRK